MPHYQWRTLFLRSLLLSVALLRVGGAQGREITKPDLLQGLQDAEAALKTVSVTCDYEIEQRPPPLYSLTSKKMHGVCIFDVLGRSRFEGDAEVQDPTKQQPWHERLVGVYDGKRGKEIQGNEQRFVRGYIREKAGVPWPLDPREYLYRFFSKSVGKELAEEDPRILGFVAWEGRQLTAVETKVHVDAQGNQRKSRFLIDCDRGFAVVRRSIAIFRPAANDWFDYVFVEGKDYSEASTGIWVPTKVKEEMYGSSSTVLNPPCFLRVVVRNSNWVLNASLPSTQFTLEFPPLIMVMDEQTGATYQTVQMKNDKIIAQIGEGLQVYKEKKDSLFARTLLLWAGGCTPCCRVRCTGIVVFPEKADCRRKR
jgi:hypothetical protein